MWMKKRERERERERDETNGEGYVEISSVPGTFLSRVTFSTNIHDIFMTMLNKPHNHDPQSVTL